MIPRRTCFLKQVFFLLFIFPATRIFSQSTVTVTDSNLQGWVKDEQHLGKIVFTNGPSKPPLKGGSVVFYAPVNGASGRFVRMRNSEYSGVLLSSLTHLSYSTFIQQADSEWDAPVVVLQVDNDGDGIVDNPIVFHVKYQTTPYIEGKGTPAQGPLLKNAWQTWDALHGVWFTGPTTDPDTGSPLYKLSTYISQYPNARIMNNHTGGGLRLQAGGRAFADNFIGNADAFTIGVNGKTTVYDFELGMDTAQH